MERSPVAPLDSAQRKRLLASRVLGGLAIIFVFASGYLLGIQWERSHSILDLSKFWRVYSLVSSKYPGVINEEKAVDGAIRGFIDSLEDPHSAYLDELEYRQLEEDLTGEFEGIGAVLTQRDGKTVVVEPIEDSPAIRAGLQSDDEIIAVDGISVSGLVLEEVITKIRGQKGTSVTLTVQRNGTQRDFEIVRDTIDVKSVSSELSGTVGIIRITQFGDDTVDGVKAAVEALEKQGATKYLLDLRDNPGGYLNVAVSVSELFLPPNSVVVKQVYQGGHEDSLKTGRAPLLPTKPLYVFINGGSASASEIVAGALQDHGRAEVIGEKSFGKGSVQDILPLRGSTALRLTIAEWLTPDGRHINKVGIEPDKGIIADDDDAELNQAFEYIGSK